MSAIDNVKNVLNFTISDGSKKLPCYVNDDQMGQMNHIALYYVDDTQNETMQLGRHTKIGFYSTEIQVGVRHNDYTKARTACYSALEHLGVNRKNPDNSTGIYLDLYEATPEYKGIDDTGAELWAFNLFIKGAK